MTESVTTENKQTTQEIQPENIQKVETKIDIQKEEQSPPIKTEENQANWKKFREDREIERKARKEAEEMASKKHAEAEALKAAMDALLNKQQPQQNQQQYQNEYNEETTEQVIERKIKAAIEKDRQSQREEQQRIEAQTYPQRIIQEHKDFNNVCTPENMDYLEYHYPEVATAYRYMPDGFEKWSSIYKAIKKFVPSGKKEDEARMIKNAQKPQANIPTMTDTKPQTSGWKLTEERRKENWERMQKDRRSIG